MEAPRIVEDGIDVQRRDAPAGIVPRLMPLFYDLAVLLLPAQVWVGLTAYLEMSGAMPASPRWQLIREIMSGTILLLPPLYFVLMECSPLQGTLGKLAYGLKVTDLDGGRISLTRAAGRMAAKVFLLVHFPLLPIDRLFRRPTPGRMLWDHMSGCQVVPRAWEPGAAPPTRDAPQAVETRGHTERITTRGGVRETGPR